ncbi:unnamed protein product [Amoebophrya sp. A120]|nr:unnamed protein product [Amoebophrya sp. A120]|eukprot:GSA120T00008486001.1
MNPNNFNLPTGNGGTPGFGSSSSSSSSSANLHAGGHQVANHSAFLGQLSPAEQQLWHQLTAILANPQGRGLMDLTPAQAQQVLQSPTLTNWWAQQVQENRNTPPGMQLRYQGQHQQQLTQQQQPAWQNSAVQQQQFTQQQQQSHAVAQIVQPKFQVGHRVALLWSKFGGMIQDRTNGIVVEVFAAPSASRIPGDVKYCYTIEKCEVPYSYDFTHNFNSETALDKVPLLTPVPEEKLSLAQFPGFPLAEQCRPGTVGSLKQVASGNGGSVEILCLVCGHWRLARVTTSNQPHLGFTQAQIVESITTSNAAFFQYLPNHAAFPSAIWKHVPSVPKAKFAVGDKVCFRGYNTTDTRLWKGLQRGIVCQVGTANTNTLDASAGKYERSYQVEAIETKKIKSVCSFRKPFLSESTALSGDSDLCTAPASWSVSVLESVLFEDSTFGATSSDDLQSEGNTVGALRQQLASSSSGSSTSSTNLDPGLTSSRISPVLVRITDPASPNTNPPSWHVAYLCGVSSQLNKYQTCFELPHKPNKPGAGPGWTKRYFDLPNDTPFPGPLVKAVPEPQPPLFDVGRKVCFRRSSCNTNREVSTKRTSHPEYFGIIDTIVPEEASLSDCQFTADGTRRSREYRVVLVAYEDLRYNEENALPYYLRVLEEDLQAHDFQGFDRPEQCAGGTVGALRWAERTISTTLPGHRTRILMNWNRGGPRSGASPNWLPAEVCPESAQPFRTHTKFSSYQGNHTQFLPNHYPFPPAGDKNKCKLMLPKFSFPVGALVEFLSDDSASWLKGEVVCHWRNNEFLMVIARADGRGQEKKLAKGDAGLEDGVRPLSSVVSAGASATTDRFAVDDFGRMEKTTSSSPNFSNQAPAGKDDVMKDKEVIEQNPFGPSPWIATSGAAADHDMHADAHRLKMEPPKMFLKYDQQTDTMVIAEFSFAHKTRRREPFQRILQSEEEIGEYVKNLQRDNYALQQLANAPPEVVAVSSVSVPSSSSSALPSSSLPMENEISEAVATTFEEYASMVMNGRAKQANYTNVPSSHDPSSSFHSVSLGHRQHNQEEQGNNYEEPALPLRRYPELPGKPTRMTVKTALAKNSSTTVLRRFHNHLTAGAPREAAPDVLEGVELWIEISETGFKRVEKFLAKNLKPVLDAMAEKSFSKADKVEQRLRLLPLVSSNRKTKAAPAAVKAGELVEKIANNNERARIDLEIKRQGATLFNQHYKRHPLKPVPQNMLAKLMKLQPASAKERQRLEDLLPAALSTKLAIPNNADTPEAPAPKKWTADPSLQLRPEQKQALAWMIQRENCPETFTITQKKAVAPKIFSSCYSTCTTNSSTNGGSPAAAGQFLLEFELTYQYNLNGGILADKVGFGKTATLLSLLASQEDLAMGRQGGSSDARKGRDLKENEKQAKITSKRKTNNNKKKKEQSGLIALPDMLAEDEDQKRKRPEDDADQQMHNINHDNTAPSSPSPHDLIARESKAFFPAPKTTLILVPSHLIDQWSKEIQKFCTSYKWSVLVMKDVRGITTRSAKELAGYDIILCTFQCLYSSVYAKRVLDFLDKDDTGGRTLGPNASYSVQDLRKATADYIQAWDDHQRGSANAAAGANPAADQLKATRTSYFESRFFKGSAGLTQNKIKSLVQGNGGPEGVLKKSKSEDLLFPVFEQFFFRRIVYDEFHEAECIKGKTGILIGLKAVSKWGLTGTPTVDSVQNTKITAGVFGIDIIVNGLQPGADFTEKGPQFGHGKMPPPEIRAIEDRDERLRKTAEWKQEQCWRASREGDPSRVLAPPCVSRVLHENAQGFINACIRQNSENAMVSSIKQVQHAVAVEFTAAERALYVATEAQLSARNGIDVSASQLSEPVLNRCSQLLQRCSHFSAGTNAASPAEEMKRQHKTTKAEIAAQLVIAKAAVAQLELLRRACAGGQVAGHGGNDKAVNRAGARGAPSSSLSAALVAAPVPGQLARAVKRTTNKTATSSKSFASSFSVPASGSNVEVSLMNIKSSSKAKGKGKQAAAAEDKRQNAAEKQQDEDRPEDDEELSEEILVLRIEPAAKKRKGQEGNALLPGSNTDAGNYNKMKNKSTSSTEGQNHDQENEPTPPGDQAINLFARRPITNAAAASSPLVSFLTTHCSSVQETFASFFGHTSECLKLGQDQLWKLLYEQVCGYKDEKLASLAFPPALESAMNAAYGEDAEVFQTRKEFLVKTSTTSGTAVVVQQNVAQLQRPAAQLQDKDAAKQQNKKVPSLLDLATASVSNELQEDIKQQPSNRGNKKADPATTQAKNNGNKAANMKKMKKAVEEVPSPVRGGAGGASSSRAAEIADIKNTTTSKTSSKQAKNATPLQLLTKEQLSVSTEIAQELKNTFAKMQDHARSYDFLSTAMHLFTAPDSEIRCSVCNTEVNPLLAAKIRSSFAVAKCGHLFCKACLKTRVQSEKKCCHPNCQQPLATLEPPDVYFGPKNVNSDGSAIVAAVAGDDNEAGGRGEDSSLAFGGGSSSSSSESSCDEELDDHDDNNNPALAKKRRRIEPANQKPYRQLAKLRKPVESASLKAVPGAVVIAPGSFHHFGSKIEAVCKELRRIKVEFPGEKVIVFVQWAGIENKLATAFTKYNFNYMQLHGGSYKQNRIINSFKEDASSEFGESPEILLLSLETQASGTDLSRASHVFLVHPMLGRTTAEAMAYEQQATGRVIRMGQKRTAHIYRFYTRGTVEEKLHLKARQAPC